MSSLTYGRGAQGKKIYKPDVECEKGRDGPLLMWRADVTKVYETSTMKPGDEKVKRDFYELLN